MIRSGRSRGFSRSGFSRSGFSRSGRSRSRSFISLSGRSRSRGRGGSGRPRAPIVIQKDDGNTCLIVALVIFGLLILGGAVVFGLWNWGVITFGDDAAQEEAQKKLAEMKNATNKMDDATKKMQAAVADSKKLAGDMKKSASDVHDAATKIDNAHANSGCSPLAVICPVVSFLCLGFILCYWNGWGPFSEGKTTGTPDNGDTSDKNSNSGGNGWIPAIMGPSGPTNPMCLGKEILDKESTGQESAIKRAYRKQSLKFHPDTCTKKGEKKACEKAFREITEQKDALLDVLKDNQKLQDASGLDQRHLPGDKSKCQAPVVPGVTS